MERKNDGERETRALKQVFAATDNPGSMGENKVNMMQEFFAQNKLDMVYGN